MSCAIIAVSNGMNQNGLFCKEDKLRRIIQKHIAPQHACVAVTVYVSEEGCSQSAGFLQTLARLQMHGWDECPIVAAHVLNIDSLHHIFKM